MTKEKPKPTRGRPRKLDPDRTLDTAVQAYWTEDPADVSLNAICQRAGVSKPSLYREFGNEDGLMCAALDRYADKVLSDIFGILSQDVTLNVALDDLVHFASRDPKMATGCLYYKMRAGKHRLGAKTRQRIDEINAAALQAYEAFFHARRDAGDWTSDVPVGVAARFLSEQIGLALTQRASGEDPEEIHDTLVLALSAIKSS